MGSALVQPLPDGPLDIVRDVHGEIEALRALLDRLGYAEDDLCVFGHYSLKVGKPHDFGNAHCVDYAVAKRWKERRSDRFDGTFRGKLAALRIPERTVLFDDGGTDPLTRPAE